MSWKNTLGVSARRCAQRFSGRGPVGLVGLEDLLSARIKSFPQGICGPENLNGVINGITVGAQVYNLPDFHGGMAEVAKWHTGDSRFSMRPLVPTQELEFVQLSDVCSWGFEGVVYDPESRCAIEETVRMWGKVSSEHRCLSSPRIPKASHLDGRILSLLTRSGECFYHFLVEGVAKMGLLPEGLLGQFDRFLVNGRGGSWHESWLRAAGIAPERMIFCDAHSHFYCESLTFCTSIMGEQHPTPWHGRNLKNLFGSLLKSKSCVSDSAPILVSRSDTATRKFQIEEQLLKRVPSLRRVELSRIPVEDQVRLFESSSLVIGMHGSGLTNTVWMRPGAAVIEVFETNQWSPMYSRISSVCGLKHHCVFPAEDDPYCLETLVELGAQLLGTRFS